MPTLQETTKKSTEESSLVSFLEESKTTKNVSQRSTPRKTEKQHQALKEFFLSQPNDSFSIVGRLSDDKSFDESLEQSMMSVRNVNYSIDGDLMRERLNEINGKI